MYKIRDWYVSEDTCLLRKDGIEKKISPRCMDVLVYLIEREGTVVSAQELLEQLWPSSSATDHAVHKVLTSLRRALDDDPSAPTYIRTYPKRGYRFIADVHRLSQGNTEQVHENAKGAGFGLKPITSSNRGYRLLVSALCFGAIFVFSAFGYKGLQQETVPGELSLLPIIISDNTGNIDSYLQRGIENSLLANLTLLPNVRIFSAPDEITTQPAWNEYAAEVGAENILLAEFIGGPEQLGIAIKLSDVDSSEQLYVEQFYATKDNVIDVQTEIVANTVAALSLYLNEEQRVAMRDWGTRSAIAYDHFLKAEFFRQQHNHRGWDKAIKYYERAIEADPNFVNAYSGLATAANYKAVYSSGSEKQPLLTLLDRYCQQLELRAPGDPAIDTMKSIALNVASIDQTQLVNRYRDAILTGDAPKYVYAQMGLYLMGARMYDEAAQFLELARNSESLLASPNQRANFKPAMLTPWDSIDVLKDALYEYPNHMGHLTVIISNLAIQGRLEEAEVYFGRQKKADLVGVRTHLGEVLLASAKGELEQAQTAMQLGAGRNTTDKYHHLFSEEALADPDLQFNNGLMSLIMGDIDSARLYWSNLNDPDRRRMFTTLYGLEMFIPKSVLNSARYARLLEDTGVGISWQRHLIEIVMETEVQTGVALNPKTRSHYDSNTYMLFNNLWTDQDWVKIKR